MRKRRGRGGSIEEGSAGSRFQRLRAVGGPQHAPASLAAVEQNRSDQGLVNVSLDLERYLSSGPRCRSQSGNGIARKVNPSADFVLGLTSCREGRAQVFQGLNLLQEHATEVDGVLCPGVWLH